MAEQTGVYVSFQAAGKLLAKVARQGKVGPLITKCGLKSDGHNLPVGLKSGPVGSAVQISKRRAHLTADTEGVVW
jgi:hypothetical protein